MAIYAKIDGGSIAARNSTWDGFDESAALDEGFVPFDVPDAGWLQIADGVIVVVDPTAARAQQLLAETAAEYEQRLEQHVDSVARTGTGLLTFKNSESAVSYTDDSDPAVAAASQAFKAWRSAFWAAATVIKGDVLAGSRTMPTVEEAIAELPKMVWPA